MECLARQGENKTQVNIQSGRKGNNIYPTQAVMRWESRGRWRQKDCREDILQDPGLKTQLGVSERTKGK